MDGNVLQKIKQLLQKWDLVNSLLVQDQVSLQLRFIENTQIIKQELSLLSQLVDAHKLSLDPAEGGYFLIMSTLSDLPELIELLSKLRGEGAQALLKKDISFNERARIYALLKMSEAKFDEINSSIEKAKQANPSFKPELDRQDQNLKSN